MVGAGYTGLASALFLPREGFSVVVLASERVGFGASGRNGGQVTGGQRRDVDWMEVHLGKSLAHELWALGNESRDLVKSLVHELAIDCDLTPGVATVAHRARYVPDYHRLVDKLTGDYGATNLDKLDAEATEALLGTRAFFGGYVDWDAAHLHPLDLALGVARHALDIGIDIHERSRVDGFEERNGKVRVRTAHGTVSADHLELATNGYLGALAPPLASRIMPINNFIVATAPLGPWSQAAVGLVRTAAGRQRLTALKA